MPQATRETVDGVKTIMLAGGGTAGHIEPAMAVADAIMDSTGTSGATGIRDKKIRVIALGTYKGLDSVLIPARGYQLELTDPIPLPRTINLQLLTLPFRLIKSVWKTYRIIRRNQVKAIIGFGGYVALSAYLAARIPPRVPVIVHEANIRPGLANKIGARLAYKSVSSHRVSGFGSQIVGTPVRKAIASLDRIAMRPIAREKFGITEKTGKVVLVFGGSQGAKSINTALAAALPKLLAAGIYIIHAYGSQNEPIVLSENTSNRELYLGFPYIEDMAMAYAASDLVIARSGAMTVAELSNLGIPAIYIPLGHGNGEQTLNAEIAVNAGAAIMLEDATLDGLKLQQEILDILDWTEPKLEVAEPTTCSTSSTLTEKSIPDRYTQMCAHAQELISVDAAETLAQLVLGLIDGL